MGAPRFVHLRLHSEYSVTDGAVRIDDAVERARDDGMPALALTDAANVFGMVKFYRAARAAGVKPVIGVDAWLQNETDRDKPFRILLLCASRAGYQRLCDLLSRAWLRNQHRGRGEIARAWLEEKGATEGLIALSGAAGGDVGQALLGDHAEAAERLAEGWARLFPGGYYLELQRAGHPQRRSAGRAHRGARLARSACRWWPRIRCSSSTPSDFQAHEARVCIATGHVLGDQRRPKRFTPEQYFKRQDEMAKLFADIPHALQNSIEIARRCNLSIELGKSRLPAFPTPAGVSVDEHLQTEAQAGLEKRRLHENPRYRERLAFEIRTIIQMGYAGYFLIVADFINWAKSNGVPVGPGRGSGAGSLVAYSLGITDLDPLKYDLLFERFLNPERVSMPDFDIDFCQDGRDRVIDYVRRKYGEESVSQIATFGTMAARAVLRDCGRVLDLGYNFCDQVAKLIPVQPGKLITLEDARKMEPLLAEREKNEDEVKELLEFGGKLEGMVRNVGMHAGGVLIAPGRLTDFCPLYSAEGGVNVISQLDKDDVEAIGLVKFDFLGLTTLTILDWAERYVRRLGLADFSLEKVPLDDAQAYKLLSSGNTTAVFQLESRGMRDLIKRARPDRFEDVIALVALYRPGPMDLIPEYIERKHGKRVEYLDPRLVPILGPTYGIMVYQEQVMQIAQVIGGYTLGGADLLRRAMGKKKPEEMALQRDIFVAGAEKNGLPKAKATQLFDLMEKFAGYGFNKSHAAAYALLAYQTAYMKAHHAAAFAAANLSAVMDDTDKVRQFHEDAVANGLKVLPPDVNASEYRFVPVDRGTVRYGLGAVRGTGQGAIESILAARKQAPFHGSVRLLRARRQAPGEPARGRGAGARGRLRCSGDESRAPARLRGPGAGSGRAGRSAGVAEQPVRRGRGAARRRARLHRCTALGRAAEAARGEGRARLLSLGAPVLDLCARAVEVSAHAARQAEPEREGVDGGRGGLGAHADDAARPHDGGDARRRQRAGRDLGVQRAVRAPPRQAEGGRAAHRFGQGAGRPVLRGTAGACGRLARSRGAAHALRRAPQDRDERRRRREATAAGARPLPRQRQRRVPGGRFLWQRQGRLRGRARRALARAAGQQAHLRPGRLAHAGERGARRRKLARPAHRASLFTQ